MNRLLPFSLVLLTLSACSASNTATDVGNEHIRNPLVAEQYWSDLTDTMVNLMVNEKAELEKAKLTSYVDGIRQQAHKMSQEALADRKKGLLGEFARMKQDVQGYVLVRPEDGTLFTGSNFESDPGPSVHIIFTEMLDPRTGEFPDESSYDIGELSSPYGPQQYVFDASKWKKEYITVALYDIRLKRLYGFAQIRPQV